MRKQIDPRPVAKLSPTPDYSELVPRYKLALKDLEELLAAEKSGQFATTAPVDMVPYGADEQSDDDPSDDNDAGDDTAASEAEGVEHVAEN